MSSPGARVLPEDRAATSSSVDHLRERVTHLGERVVILEQGVQTIVDSLKEASKDRRAFEERMKEEFRSIHLDLKGAGKPTDFRAIGGAIIMTATIMSALLAGANFWYSAKAGPTEQAVERLERQFKDGSPELLRYRIELLEKRLSKETH